MSEQQPARHVPVMLSRIVDLLAPALTAPGAVYVDCTLGLGGHAEAILDRCPHAHLIGIDRDPQALAHARERLAAYADRVSFAQAVYDELPQVLADHGRPRVQAILADLGLSSLQIDRADRGFAYSVDAPLDMRMDGSQRLTAAAVVNTYSVAELQRILSRFGEERFAPRVARAIVAARDVEPFTSSQRLVQTVADAIPMAARKTGGHPAKRTFQALRIEVNRELAALDGLLPAAIAALAVGGRLAILSYHSLEDRAVKQALRVASEDRAPRDLPVVPPGYGPELVLLTRGAEKPSADEIADNPRAASARLRAAERIEEAA
ncbi:MAG TPA: 16S rRNA (cytosine(1402)-N(4))-methyltransferase RsmH [Propionibacterium sp.]|jgi:16S rRNA (cytosine1402-N4)-methyltransferase|nr:16S rRNA (cytosine(1402)-N(4))-methyltransferase RsmH [Propionibacterium sp.]